MKQAGKESLGKHVKDHLTGPLFKTSLKRQLSKLVVTFCLATKIGVQQSCQLPDFSLRCQTICDIADISTTFFYICLIPRPFHIPSQNPQQEP